MKIALCLSGQARSYEKGYEYHKKNLLDHYDVDVFYHTWRPLDRDDRRTQRLKDELVVYNHKAALKKGAN